MRLIYTFFLVTGFLALSSCVHNPGGVRIDTPDGRVSAEYIEEIEFSSWRIDNGIAVGKDFVVYMEGVDQSLSGTAIWSFTGGDSWIVRPDAESFRTRSLKHHPRRPEAYTAACDHSDDPESPPFDILHIDPDRWMEDTGDQFWQGVRARDFDFPSPVECRFSWAIGPDDAIYMATKEALFRARDGQVEMVIGDLLASTGLSERCMNNPRIAVGPDGTAILYIYGGQYQSCIVEEGSGENLLFRIEGNTLQHIVIERLRGIEAAAVGPNGDIYVIGRQFEVDNTYASNLIARRIDGGHQSTFLRDDNSTRFKAMAFDANGDIHLVFQQGGDWFEERVWLAKYPTGE